MSAALPKGISIQDPAKGHHAEAMTSFDMVLNRAPLRRGFVILNPRNIRRISRAFLVA
jgi:hypothetical protein